ncbi:MAG: phosphatase PAP2 family protein [Bacteroidota bacterium]
MRSLFALLFLFSVPAFSQNADINLLKKFNVERNRKLDNTFRYFSYSAAPAAIAEPAALFAVWMIKKDSASRANFFTAGFSVAYAAVFTTGIKYAVNRPRCFVTYPFIDKCVDAGSPSFPSGHTSAAFSVATSLSLCYPKWYVIAPSFLWACGVGYSRMHLGVHYPSDVLIGALIGTASAFLGYKTQQWLEK